MIALILLFSVPYIIFSLITLALVSYASKWDDDPLNTAQMILVSFFPVVNLFMFGYSAWLSIIKSLE